VQTTLGSEPLSVNPASAWNGEQAGLDANDLGSRLPGDYIGKGGIERCSARGWLGSLMFMNLAIHDTQKPNAKTQNAATSVILHPKS
jgi:hypothetical protein